MVAFFILGVCLLVGLLAIGKWFVSADPRRLAQVLRVLAIGIGAGLVLYLALTGRIAVASIIIGGLLPLLMRWRATGRQFRNAQGPDPGGQSEVATRFLRMSLDHDTGMMSGTVLDGPYGGAALHDLSLAELLDLLRQCRVEDPQAVTLLETYLDRTQEGWRAAEERGADGNAGGGASGGTMTVEEACRILGLAPGAGEAEIRQAHRRLMQKLHPDRGGSSYLAAKINEAKDFLLRT